MPHRVVHFEIHAPDPEPVLNFYSRLFGWQAQQWGDQDYWLMTTGGGTEPGINGAIMKSQDGQPRVVNTIQVDSVDAFAERVADAGGQIVVPKMAIPGVGYVVYCTDPGGSIFGVYESDPEAK